MIGPEYVKCFEEALQPYAALAAAIADGEQDLTPLVYVHEQMPDGRSIDKTYRNRLGVLVYLQFHRSPDNEDLVRSLMREETEARTTDAFQGESTALYLSAYLLGTYVRPQDVWLYWRAKRANFDTFCGIDIRYLFAAGVEPTLAEIEGGHTEESRALRQHLLEYGTPLQSEVDDWWSSLTHEYPARLGEADPKQLSDYASELGSVEIGQCFLELWESQHATTERDWRELMYRWAELDRHDKALDYARRIEKGSHDDPFQTASALHTLADRAAEAGEWDEGLKAVQRAVSLVHRHPDWKKLGLYRMLAVSALTLSESAPTDHPVALRAMKQAEAIYEDGCVVSYKMLAQAARAADRIGDHRTAARFHRLAAEEHERIQRGREDATHTHTTGTSPHDARGQAGD